MNAQSTVLDLRMVDAMLAPASRARTGIFKRNARKVEREMLIHAEIAYEVRDKFPLMMNLITIAKWMARSMHGL